MNDALRATLARSLAWNEAHATFDHAVADLPAHLRGVRPPGVPWSAWQLVEHIRVAQRDILEFSLPDEYHAMKWPDDYWPGDPEPPSEAAWDESVATVRRDRDAFARLAVDAAIDLAGTTPHGSGAQTQMRAILLVLDHNAYHVGQLVLLRRFLGAWNG